MHELETLRPLLESALVQVQMPAEPRNFALRLVNVPVIHRRSRHRIRGQARSNICFEPIVPGKGAPAALGLCHATISACEPTSIAITVYRYSKSQHNQQKGIEVMNGRRSGVPQQPRPGALVHG